VCVYCAAKGSISVVGVVNLKMQARRLEDRGGVVG